MITKTFLIVALILCISMVSASSITIPEKQDRVNAPSLDNVKIITFDMFAALMQLEKSVIANVLTTLGDKYDHNKLVQFAKKWVNSYHQPRMDPKDTTPIFRYMLEETLNSTLKTFKIDLSTNDNLYWKLLRSWEILQPWPLTGNVLSSLRNVTDAQGNRRFKLAVLSNGDYDTLAINAWIFQTENQFKFDYIFSSTPVKVFKPNPAIYNQVITRLGYGKDEVFHIAGAPGDAHGSKKFGFITGWNNELKNKYPFTDSYPDYPMETLQGVLDLFQ